MTAPHISRHAIERYQERVENIPDDEVRLRIDTPALRLAIKIGAPYVKLGTKHRIALSGNDVVTVLPAEHRPHQLRKRNHD